MFNSLTGILALLFAMQFLAGCGVLTQGTLQTDPLSHQRIADEEQKLLELAEIDSLIKVNNDWLEKEFSREIMRQAAASNRLVFRNLNFKFSKQIIHIIALVDVSDHSGNVISADVSGEVMLGFSPTQLVWTPQFEQLRISSRDFVFEDVSYTGPVPDELGLRLLQYLNADVVEALTSNGDNIIAFDAVPLGEVQVGAQLPGINSSPAQQKQALRGKLMLAGSVTLIDSRSTTSALDMTFVPDVSECPVDVTVTRAEFAGDIESREPVDIVRSKAQAADIRYFFSEISGAKKPLTIIHYWFANGFPLAVEELPVGTSERWRTWSNSGSAHSDGDRLQVLVVEKETGCILLSKAIQSIEPGRARPDEGQDQVRTAFNDFREEFGSRIADFSIREDEPEIALVETRRVFLRDVLQASLRNLNIDADFDESAFTDRDFNARLRPFEAEDIKCDRSNCPPAPVCKINISHCKHYRDTRDCVSCLFRNPLNNRCVSEATDPLCEASRERQNARFEAEREECIGRAEESKQECERLSEQASRSCQIESGFADSVCESVRGSLKDFEEGSPLAHINAKVNTRGKLQVNYSNFRMEGDLERLKLDMSLLSDLQLEGQIRFNPGDTGSLLTTCVANWSSPFRSSFSTTQTVKNLLSNFEKGQNVLIAQWSGFGLSIEGNTSPLETVFVGNPQLLANCGVGLTVDQVEKSISGADAGFYRGHIELEIQPLPTEIQLAPASVIFGNDMYSGKARLSSSHLRHDIAER